MKLRTIYILFGILGVLLVLVAVAMFNATPPADTSLYALPGAHDPKHPLEATDVDRVEIKRVRPKEETIVLIRDAKTARWEITEPHKLRAGPVVKDLVTEVLNASRDPEADVPADAKTAGLEPPAAVVTLTATGGDKDKKGEARSVQLNVGDASSESSKAVIYVSSPERPKDILPVRRSRLATVLDTVNDFRDPALLASASSDYARVKLNLAVTDKAKAPKGPLELKKMDDGLWRYTDSLGYDGSAETGDPGAVTEPGKRPAGVDGLLKVLSDLRVESANWVQDGATDTDLVKYDLDSGKTDVLTVEVDRALTEKDAAGAEQKIPMTLLVAVGKKVGDKADRYYAAVKDEEHGTTVVRIPTTGPDSLAQEFTDPTALRSKTLVALGGFKKPLAVRVTNETGKLEFLRLKETDDWRLFRDGKELPLDKTAASNLLLVNQLMQPDQVRSFIDAPDEAKLGLNDKSPMIEIWVDGVEEEKKPEAKDGEKKDDKKDVEKKDEPKPKLLLKSDKPAARLTYGTPELDSVHGDLAPIKRYEEHTGWSETAVVKAPKLLEDQATAGPLTYYDKALPNFGASQDVVALELDRADGPFVVFRDKADSPWAFKTPTDWDKSKVNGFPLDSALGDLERLQATKLIVEAPSKEDQDSDKYGLNKPSVKVVLTKKVGEKPNEKTETYTFTFGKDAPDGGVYAQQSQRSMVFEVDKGLVNFLNSLFAVDPSRVKSLKLTRLIPGSVNKDEVEFDKMGDQWTPKPAFPVDNDKVNALVKGLARLTVKEVAAKDDKISLAFREEEKKGALTIEMTVEGLAQPVTLTVVNLTGDKPDSPKGLYATSPNSPSLPPGEIFPAPKELFDGPMSGSAYFKKP